VPDAASLLAQFASVPRGDAEWLCKQVAIAQQIFVCLAKINLFNDLTTSSEPGNVRREVD
jgi:hypothetical protein